MRAALAKEKSRSKEIIKMHREDPSLRKRDGAMEREIEKLMEEMGRESEERRKLQDTHHRVVE